MLFFSLLQIPFVVIVQPHLLQKKGVQLKSTMSNASFRHINTGDEEFIPLNMLASTINERLVDKTVSARKEENHHFNDEIILSPRKDQKTNNGVGGISPGDIQIVYVESDQYYGHERFNIEDRSEHKTVRKAISAMKQRTISFVDELVGTDAHELIVFGINLPFKVVRELGTILMFGESNHSIGTAYLPLTESYPKHKKLLKSLCNAIENMLDDGHASNKKILLYSKSDDMFDLVTLSKKSKSNRSSKSSKESNQNKSNNKYSSKTRKK